MLLVGLGNPGAKYARHRHNVGFMAVDAIADKYNFSPARQKFQGEIREGFLETAEGRKKALILKPSTFMNDSGRSVRAACDFFKFDPSDVIVFYDELDLAPGKLRVKTGGGAAGHNGIRSIDAHIGNDFRRVRIGIGHPGAKSKVTGHVLGDFAKADQQWLSPLLDAIARSAPYLLVDDQRFASDVAQQLAPLRDNATKEKTAQRSPTKPDQKEVQTSKTNQAKSINPFTDAFRNFFSDSNKED